MNRLDAGGLFAAVTVDSWSYIASAWIICVVVLGAYALGVMRRGRVAARRVPSVDRRWMTSRRTPQGDAWVTDEGGRE